MFNDFTFTLSHNSRTGLLNGIRMKSRKTIANHKTDETTVTQFVEYVILTIETEIARATGKTVGSAKIVGSLLLVTSGEKDQRAFSYIDPDQETDTRRRIFSHLIFDHILKMFDGLTQSQQSLTLHDVEFFFQPKPSSVATGAGPAKPPSWWGNLPYKNIIWKQHFDSALKPVNCAAISLVFGKNPAHYNNRPKALADEAKELQDSLQWGEYVSVVDLRKYIEKFTDECIILLHYAMKTKVIRGKDFDLSSITTGNVKPPKTIFLYFDVQQRHYALVSRVVPYLKKIRPKSNLCYCHFCNFIYNYGHHVCEDEVQRQKKRKIILTCKYCEFVHIDKKDCPYRNCTSCWSTFEKDQTHRCAIHLDNEYKFFDEEGKNDGSKTGLWAWDIESRQEEEPVEEVEGAFDDFLVDDDHRFLDHTNVTVVTKVSEHIPNLVVAQNVFTKEMHKFKGEHCLEDFLQFITQVNKGKNHVYAHNSSGYDSRLLLNMICEKTDKHTWPKQILRGTKILCLSFENTRFLDSMNHLPGSLKSLAKSMARNTNMEKGHFPHLFNKLENYSYVGELPSLEYFTVPFYIKTEKDYEEFMNWHEERKAQGPWNFQEELEKYCVNDVEILSAILESFHRIHVDENLESPLFSVTAPAYVSKCSIRGLTMINELPPKTVPDQRKEKLYEMSQEAWPVNTKEEHHFDSLALRGGRTDLRKLLCEITEDEFEAGKRIPYVDIISEYPSCQYQKDFPAGTPIIHVYDYKAFPCQEHVEFGYCSCNYRDRTFSQNMTVVDHSREEVDIETLIRREDFFGIAMVDAIPPRGLYHPVLVHFDKDRNKCIASLEPIERKTFTCVELKTALEEGYKITKIYRYHQYKKKPSLWKPDVKKFFFKKTFASMDTMSDEMIEAYESKFGWGEEFREARDRGLFKKDGSVKTVAKMHLNSMWGKHCENTNKRETHIISDLNDFSVDVIEKNVLEGRVSLKNIVPIGNEGACLYTFTKDISTTYPNTTKGFMAAGLHVPAYGRLMLFEQLSKLGERAIYNDTDSIIYECDINDSQYKIPEGKCLGDWEHEEFTDILGFVGWQPKSYAVINRKGEEIVKFKGLSTTRSTRSLLNYRRMKEVVLKVVKEYFENVDAGKEDAHVRYEIPVPQQTFVYNYGRNMKTVKGLKFAAIDTREFKGDLQQNFTIRPFGY